MRSYIPHLPKSSVNETVAATNTTTSTRFLQLTMMMVMMMMNQPAEFQKALFLDSYHSSCTSVVCNLPTCPNPLSLLWMLHFKPWMPIRSQSKCSLHAVELCSPVLNNSWDSKSTRRQQNSLPE
ncbi:hypothetical protein CRM22_003974 [Opisthorchis felineus]|uniref:Uncharacterized protein n=1 Tax=Opisthorchis felineus TaxID=147828 RepID=A0A4S2LYP6_OPIFE|nr:hypothetical protein CRM22_003974 [Opisthorchis felineus]